MWFHPILFSREIVEKGGATKPCLVAYGVLRKKRKRDSSTTLMVHLEMKGEEGRK
jgi:hypothetical protein